MMAFSRRQFLAGLAACPACAAATGVARAEDAHWSYADPQDWGADRAFRACSIGGEQSPVNLSGAVRAEIEPPAVSWRAEAFGIVNNGHTIQANASPGGFATRRGASTSYSNSISMPRANTRWTASGRRWRPISSMAARAEISW